MSLMMVTRIMMRILRNGGLMVLRRGLGHLWLLKKGGNVMVWRLDRTAGSERLLNGGQGELKPYAVEDGGGERQRMHDHRKVLGFLEQVQSKGSEAVAEKL